MSIQEILPSQPLPRFSGIETDSQSGAILKILSDAKFTPKAGGNYRIYHMPQSNDFTVEENWEEISPEGVTVPRKKYTHFTIKNDIPGSPDIIPNQPTLPGKPQPLSPEAPNHHENIPSSEPAPLAEPLPLSKPDSFETSPDREPKQPRQKTSLEILTEKFAIVSNHVVPDPIIPDHVPTPEIKPLEETPSTPEIAPKPEDPVPALVSSVYGLDHKEWYEIQNLAFDIFMHPENYNWGKDHFGKPIEHTVKDYPERSQKLHQLLQEKNLGEEFFNKPLKEILDLI